MANNDDLPCLICAPWERCNGTYANQRSLNKHLSLVAKTRAKLTSDQEDVKETMRIWFEWTYRCVNANANARQAQIALAPPQVPAPIHPALQNAAQPQGPLLPPIIPPAVPQLVPLLLPQVAHARQAPRQLNARLQGPPAPPQAVQFPQAAANPRQQNPAPAPIQDGADI